MDEQTDGSMNEREKEHIVHRRHLMGQGCQRQDSFWTFELACTCLGRPALNIVMHMVMTMLVDIFPGTQDCSVTNCIPKGGLDNQTDEPGSRCWTFQAKASQSENVTDINDIKSARLLITSFH